MIGRLLIDDNDVYSEFGVYVTQGGWNNLLAMPPLKQVTYNDWHEEEGIEADLSSPVLNTRDVTINFAVNTKEDLHLDFLALLSNGAYHTFNCNHIGRTYRLRIAGAGTYSFCRQLGLLSLKMADDFPLLGYTYQEPQSGVIADDMWMLDDRPLTDYGCRILQGTLAELTKQPEVKKNLLRNITSQSGAIYDPKRVKYKSKEVKLYCLFTAETITELWRNYDALLYDLVRPNERVLYYSGDGHGYPCYYKNCTVTEFYPDGSKVWLKCTITLVFTRDLFTDKFDKLLQSEDDEDITDEKNRNITIGGGGG